MLIHLKNHHLALLALLTSLFFYKTDLIQRRFVKAGCDDCFDLSIFLHDSIIFAGIFALWSLCHLIKAPISSLITKSLLFLLMAVYIADILTIKIFGTRLIVADIIKYGGELNATASLIAQADIKRSFVALLIISFAIFIIYKSIRTQSGITKSHHILSIGLFIIFLYTSTLNADVKHIKSMAYLNVFEVNLDKGATIPYSDNFTKNLLDRLKKETPKQSCISGERNRKNVLIIMLESFSNYHSKYFSGINDWTPNLDNIARRNRSFTKFYANGFTTEGGLISILTGRLPVAAPTQSSTQGGFAFGGYFNSKESLPAMFNQEGYLTLFFTSGNLEFSNKGEWLKSIGLNNIEGHDSPAYNLAPKRFHFESVPDEMLYQRYIEWLDNKKSNAPFFTVIETVSTHMPFLNPNTGEQSEESAVRYADQALASFYLALQDRNFFKDSILVIVSDHRAMTAIQDKESQLYGEHAPALVPMVIVDGSQQKIDQRFQQRDFFTSFKYWMTGNSCVHPLHGNFLAEPLIPADCILHAGGLDRNTVDYFCSEAEGITILNGDNTSIDQPFTIYAQKILDEINHERTR